MQYQVHEGSRCEQMSNNQKITIDFDKMYRNAISYFKNLPQDMIIAWSVIGVGIIVLIVSFCL